MNEEEIISKAKELWYMAEQEEEKEKKRGRYEFELGRAVINILADKCNDKNPTLEARLMAIPIRVNDANPYEIRLWKEIR